MTRPVIGSTGWGTALNADLDQLDERIVDLETAAPFDTGLRILTVGDGLPASKGLTGVTLRRTVGGLITLNSGEITLFTDYVAAPAGSWPQGFRPASAVTLPIINGGSATISVEPDGSWAVSQSVDGELDGNGLAPWCWVSDDAEPTTLPGSAES